ncbi:ABC transporter permease [Desulfovibrio sp.]
MNAAGLLLAVRLARRELRGGLRGFGVFLACLALGVGAVSCVGLLNASLEAGLRRDARTLLGGDLEIQQSHLPPRTEALDLLAGMGRVSLQARMRGMAHADGGRSAVVEVKAVDAAYPLYGRVVLEPNLPLAESLAERGGLFGAAADPRLLERLGLRPGQELRLGHARFQVRALLRAEPDRGGTLFNLGPRLLLSRAGLEATGLLAPGSVVTYSALARLEHGATVEEARAILARTFPDETGWRVLDHGQAAGGIRRSLDNISLYLTLVGLASLLLGGIGAAGAVRGFLASRADALAAMKAVGAERGQILAAYLVQILALAALGSAVGLLAGAVGANATAALLSRTLGVPAAPGLHPGPLLSGLAYGLLTALAFSVWPLSAAAAVSPVRLFRGYADPGTPRPSACALAVSGLCALALLTLTLLNAPAPGVVLGFAAGVALSSLALFLLARGARALARNLPRPRDPRLRLALGNIHRPGSGLTAVVFSLGLGLAVLCTVVLADLNLRDTLDRRMPASAPAYFFLDIPKNGLKLFQDTVLAVPGVTREEHAPTIRGRVVRVNGVPSEKVRPDPDAAWILRGDRGLTMSDRPPGGTSLAAGEWWPEHYQGPPLVSFGEQEAKGLGLQVGDTITVNVLGREITARVTSLRRIEWTSLALNHAMLFSPGVLDAAPYTYIATVYCPAGAEEKVFQAVARALPDVTAVYVRDVLEDVRATAGRIALAARAATAVTLLAGLLVLSQALRANLQARRREAVVFKVLGATRGDVLLSLAAEFCLLGLSTALVAAVIGALASRAFTIRMLFGGWSLHPWALAVCALAGAAATLALGLLGVRRALGQKAWPVLRNE